MTTVQDRFPGLLMTDCVYLRCATLDDVASVAGSINGVVQAYQSNEELRVEVLWEGLKRVQQIFWWTEFFVYVAIGVTLILGGGHLERDDGRGALPNQGNRSEKSRRR